MSQISTLCDTLKQLLKSRKLTYKDLATGLSLSEANIKRIFSSQSFTLERLEQICHVLEISLSDLFMLNAQREHRISQLTEEQEEELIRDPKLLLVAVRVRDGWTFQEIIDQYQVSEHECIRLMARLDKLKMLQLLPGNKYKLLIAQDFRWIPGGPLERFINREVIAEFMGGNFNQEQAFRFYLRGSYSDASIAILKHRLNQFTQEAAQLNQQDARLPLDKRHSLGLLLAMRPWELRLFASMRR
ncbi:helix-turn-helix domain-containing protein [Cellvibrio japonicus]|uniref:Predicted transcriptional regulator n=1 Tax=Cellvibrio japonicus (strain Ueda107) TaxID=498211 RepID=B3PLB0_CELJU|nr:helix-turn-helix transcriptional regulator [Cellvibrio japonicus]ACE84357.1 predicted transcriptional regulator [Cellvibrio japonicus Ueda107]QEI11566.1 helix-turn-helix transcriptional regulator [Cellvibrio japonicus]QEI15140.1 helix-turn-helix transcriptional regulator [Cellvibrio japonicus]QEI18720.1 helix-turn-helix transcriptional regulator [Cellvibrio japonicus]